MCCSYQLIHRSAGNVEDGRLILELWSGTVCDRALISCPPSMVDMSVLLPYRSIESYLKYEDNCECFVLEISWSWEHIYLLDGVVNHSACVYKI